MWFLLYGLQNFVSLCVETLQKMIRESPNSNKVELFRLLGEEFIDMNRQLVLLAQDRLEILREGVCTTRTLIWWCVYTDHVCGWMHDVQAHVNLRG